MNNLVILLFLQVQHWLPAVPTPDDWHSVCANYDRLIQFREETFAQQGVSDPKLHSNRSRQDITKEVMAFRVKLRTCDYLLHPHDSAESHKSLSGEDLDPELHKFCEHARDLRASYFEAFIQHEQTSRLMKASPPTFTEYPVFITQSDREHYTAIENLTVAKITSLVNENLIKINDEEMRDEMKRVWETEVSKKKKIAFVEFYMDLLEYLDNEEYYASLVQDAEDDPDTLAM